MDFSKKSIAQGTIEYLVIIGVVVVLSLVVVGLVMTQVDSSSSVSSTSSEIRNRVGVGGISIVDSIAGEDGNGLFFLKNMGADTLTVTSINVDGVDHNYFKPIVMGAQQGFRLSDIAVCDGTKKVYSIRVYYTSANNLSNSADFETITINCISTVPPSERVVDESDLIPPAVFLLSPLDNNFWSSSSIVGFDFNVWDKSSVSSCNLLIDGVDVNSIVPVIGVNSVSVRLDDLNFVWDVNCTDASNNTGNASVAYALSVDANRYQINNCLQLQDMNSDLTGNYILMDDINCYSDTHLGGTLWNSGAGFSPIGLASTFTGSLDGANYTVSGLFINRLSTDKIGLISDVNGGFVRNISLTDVNISGKNRTGALVGSLTGSFSIINSSVQGSVSGSSNYYVSSYYIGGLVGFGSSKNLLIESSHFSGYIYCKDYMVGGLVGMSSGNLIIRNSYAKADINVGMLADNASMDAGGLVGSLQLGSIMNSYFDGNINAVAGVTEVGGIVGIGWGSSLTNVYSKGKINTPYYWRNSFLDFGGLVGGHLRENPGITISKSYSTMDINMAGSFSSPYYYGGLYGDLKNNIANSFFAGRIIVGTYSGGDSNQHGAIVGEMGGGSSVTNSYWDSYKSTQSNCYPDGNTGCSAKNIGNSEPLYFYSQLNAPISSWGTWENISGSKWSTTDGNWSICEGQEYPWLTWENKNC